MRAMSSLINTNNNGKFGNTLLPSPVHILLAMGLVSKYPSSKPTGDHQMVCHDSEDFLFNVLYFRKATEQCGTT